MTDFDVIVVGAGPAGSTAARFAAAGGASVLLLEQKDELGIPVQCGELLPSAGTLKEIFPKAPDIEDLFETPRNCISLKIARLSLFSPAKREYALGFEANSLWRARYDRHLASLAAGEGAVLRTGVKVRGLVLEDPGTGEPLNRGAGEPMGRIAGEPDNPPAADPRLPTPAQALGVETEEGTLTARVMIGADGALSRVGRSVGFPAPGVHPCVQCTIPGDYGDGVELHFGTLTPGGHAWLVPRSKGANIGLEMKGRRQLRAVLDQFVWELGITDKPKIETDGVIPVTGPLAETVRGNVLLCGDAAGQVLAFNSWGMAPAVLCGRAAGETASAFIQGTAKLPDYEKRWRREVGEALKASLWFRRRMDRFSLNPLTMEMAFAFLRKWGIRRILSGKRIV